MAAGKYNITAEKDQDLTIGILYKDEADQGFDLGSSIITMVIKDNASDVSAALTKTFSGTVDGEFTISISRAEVNALPFNQGIYYIDIDAPDVRLLEGKIQINNSSSY